MSDHEFYMSKLITFTKNPALLGINTNGAAPERVFGLNLEAQMYIADGEVIQDFWLHARTKDGPQEQTQRPSNQNSEWVAYFHDTKQVNEVVNAIINAQVGKVERVTLPGSFDGYQNQNQIRYDNENSTDECINGLTCVVDHKNGGFSLQLKDKSVNITSLDATLSDSGVSTMLDTVREVTAWVQKTSEDFEKQIELEKAASGPKI